MSMPEGWLLVAMSMIVRCLCSCDVYARAMSMPRRLVARGENIRWICLRVKHCFKQGLGSTYIDLFGDRCILVSFSSCE